MTARLHACRPPQNLHVATPTACLESSIPLHFHVYTSTPTTRLQSSRAPELHTSSEATPVAHLPSSIPPHRHARSAPPELHTSMPLRLRACKPPPELPSSIHPRLRTCNTLPELPKSPLPTPLVIRVPPLTLAGVPLMRRSVPPFSTLDEMLIRRMTHSQIRFKIGMIKHY